MHIGPERRVLAAFRKRDPALSVVSLLACPCDAVRSNLPPPAQEPEVVASCGPLSYVGCVSFDAWKSLKQLAHRGVHPVRDRVTGDRIEVGERDAVETSVFLVSPEVLDCLV